MHTKSGLHLTRGLFVAALLSSTVHADIYDLATDWSNTTNPNGTWTYMINAQPAQAATRVGDNFSNPPGAPVIWGEGSYNSHWGWSQSNGSEQVNGWDLQAGDVYGHSYAYPMEIAWTAPSAGVMSFAGSVWALRDIGRTTTWSVAVGSQVFAVLDSGSVSSGDAFSRVNPVVFGASGLLVGAGDSVIFSARGNDYFGLNLTVDFTASQTGRGNGAGTAVPDATSTLSLLGLGLLGLAGARRLKGKSA